MDRSEFWSILDRTRSTDPEVHEARLGDALSVVPPGDLVDFERHASQLLARSFGNRLWGAAWLINRGCSDDGFDYFRGWLVAQGRAVYEAALSDPDSLADHPGLGDGDVEFEALWYLARRAYERQVGSEMPDLGPPSDEDNVEDTDFDFEDDDAMARHYPKLFARFAER